VREEKTGGQETLNMMVTSKETVQVEGGRGEREKKGSPKNASMAV